LTVVTALLVGIPATSKAAMVTNLIDDLGPLTSATGPVTFGNIVPTGTFLNDFTFTLTQLSNPIVAIVGEVVPTVLPPLTPPDRRLDMGSLMLQFFVNTGNSNLPNPLASASFASGDTVELSATLGPGDFFLRVQGDALGNDGGEFTGQVSVAAIPLPPALLLLLSGLAALGSARWWRLRWPGN